jgi:hypothetical protein
MIQMSVSEAMNQLVGTSDAFLHRLLRLTLRHILRHDLTAAEIDTLEKAAKKERIGLDELPAIMQHLKALLLRCGVAGNFEKLRAQLSDEAWGPFPPPKTLIMHGAARRWGQEVTTHAHLVDCTAHEKFRV